MFSATLGGSPATAVTMPDAEAFALGCGGHGTADGISNDCVFVRCLAHFRMRDLLRLVYSQGGVVLPPDVAAVCGSVDLGRWLAPAVVEGEATWPAVVVGDASDFHSLRSRFLAAVRAVLVRVFPSLAGATSDCGGSSAPATTVPAWFIPVIVVLVLLLVVIAVADAVLGVVVWRRRRRARAAQKAAAVPRAPYGEEADAEVEPVPRLAATATTPTTSTTTTMTLPEALPFRVDGEAPPALVGAHEPAAEGTRATEPASA